MAGLMQLIGQDPATYNVWNELGFLAEPMIQTIVTPMIGKYMSGIPDEQVKNIAMKFADIAGMKGHDVSPYFWYTFLLGIVGMLMVVALLTHLLML